MKKVYSLLGILFFAGNVFAQNFLLASYTSGDVPTSFATYDESCNGTSATITVALPAGDNYTITGVDVAYTMFSQNGGYISDQKSKIKFQNTNTEEAVEYGGTINAGGTQTYSRTNISIANGTYAGGTQLVFQMKARRIWESSTNPGCNTNIVRVNNNSWTITVYYSNVINNPKVGVQTATPLQTLDVNGKLKLGNDNTAPIAGTIRWNADTNDFEGYNGADWISFTKNEGGGWGSKDVTENSGVIASDATAGDNFGVVSISGDYAIVGAHRKNIGAIAEQGKAYIFKRTGSAWVQQAELLASDGETQDYFGYSVSISGDYAIVGAIEKNIGANNNQGKAYIFKRTGTTWAEQASLIASDGSAFNDFGCSVSISGDYAIVGAFIKDIGTNFDQGKAYIFNRTGTTWTEQASLIASDGAIYDKFGLSVSISGDYAIVGAHEKNIGINADQGKAYIFKRTGTNWAEQAGIVSLDGTAGDKFGTSVSISGDYVIIGAPRKTVEGNVRRGKAYIFKRSGALWISQYNLISSDGASYDNFGNAVSISGDYAVVGANDKIIGGNINHGKVYIFKRGTPWVEQAALITSDGASGDNFGTSLAISGNNIIVGSLYKVVGTLSVGKVYFFQK
jgi:FG-GAP repeat